MKIRVENFSPVMGRGIDSRNRVWNWVAKLHSLAGRYNNPMPTWFLAPIAGLKLPTQIGEDLQKRGQHRKKSFSIFPSPAWMSFNKLSIGGNNDVIYKLFPPRESLVSDIPAGDGNIKKLFLQCIHINDEKLLWQECQLLSKFKQGFRIWTARILS